MENVEPTAARNEAAGQLTPELVALGITMQELRVWKLLCTYDELQLKMLPEKLGITFKTVETHRDKLYEKLGVHSRVGLVLKGIAYGVVPCTCGNSAMQPAPANDAAWGEPPATPDGSADPDGPRV